MNESDLLVESCRSLLDHSAVLSERSEQAHALCAASTAQLKLLDRLSRDARAEAEQLRHLLPTAQDPHAWTFIDRSSESCAAAREEPETPPSDLVTPVAAASYLRQLHACFAVWNDAMIAIAHAGQAERSVVAIIATIGPVYRAHRQLMQLTVTPPMQAAHRAALGLLQSAMDALDAVAAGRGSSAVRDMSEQLTIFQTELVLFAEHAGVPPERAIA